MALTYVRRRLSSTAREQLYDRCKGTKAFPDCNICGMPIRIGDAWDESHDPEGPPHAMNGNDDTGVAHRECNRRHGAEVVVPLMAKVDRNRQKHIGAFQTRHKLPGGRDSRVKKKIGGGVVEREARAPKLSAEDYALIAINVDLPCPEEVLAKAGAR